MKKFDPAYSESELDTLLRQLVLDGGPDEFTQNLVDMNADFVFAQPATPATARERALISKLERRFIARPFGGWRLNSLLLVLAIAAGTWMYFANSREPEIPANTPRPAKNTPPPAALSPAGEDTSQAARQFAAYVPPADSAAVVIDSAGKADSAKTERIPGPKRYGHTNTHMPPQENWYEGNYIVDVPGPEFPVKASPENFKVRRGNFTPDKKSTGGVITSTTGGVMFRAKQDSFAAVYYTGEPFKKGFRDMQYFNFGEYAQRAQAEMKQQTMRLQTTLFPWQMPWTVMLYADSADVTVEYGKTYLSGDPYAQLVLEKYPEKGIRGALQPFYINKYEVTNKEYREFLAWVRASNGYAGKPIASFETDTLPVTNPKDKSGEQFEIKGQRYRVVRKTVQTEDYKDVFNYVFFNEKNEAVTQSGKKNLFVLPDTIAWITDFTFSYNEPMTNMYFWHPAYDDYPVVGVSWYQAMAFLDWKTHMHQKQLDAENVPYTIEYTLPSDIEWELTSNSILLGNNTAFNFYYDCTMGWLTNLGVSYPGHDDPYQRTNYLKNLFTRDQHFRGDYISDGPFHTGPVTRTYEGHEDPFGILWLDGNVSEWMLESHAQNWSPFFQKHLLVLDVDTSEATQLAKQIEILYDKGNAKNGRLVRGANWYDERFGRRVRSERNEAGIHPKRFLDPAEQHCTVGFRYVVHVKYKDESERLP